MSDTKEMEEKKGGGIAASALMRNDFGNGSDLLSTTLIIQMFHQSYRCSIPHLEL